MSNRAGFLVAALIGLLVVGSAWMKTRHLNQIAEAVTVLPPEPAVPTTEPPTTEPTVQPVEP